MTQKKELELTDKIAIGTILFLRSLKVREIKK